MTTTEAALRDALIAAYNKVKKFPEYRGAPVTVGGDGFMDLLALRNLVPQAIDALSQPSPASSTTFEQAWAIKEAEGYQYGEDALEQVRFGWELALAILSPSSGEPASVAVEAVRKEMSSPGRYKIQHPGTAMSNEQRAWEMWAVHPTDLRNMGLNREEFFLAHLRAAALSKPTPVEDKS